LESGNALHAAARGTEVEVVGSVSKVEMTIFTLPVRHLSNSS